jgi:hypothetical protein
MRRGPRRDPRDAVRGGRYCVWHPEGRGVGRCARLGCGLVLRRSAAISSSLRDILSSTMARRAAVSLRTCTSDSRWYRLIFPSVGSGGSAPPKSPPSTSRARSSGTDQRRIFQPLEELDDGRPSPPSSISHSPSTDGRLSPTSVTGGRGSPTPGGAPAISWSGSSDSSSGSPELVIWASNSRGGSRWLVLSASTLHRGLPRARDRRDPTPQELARALDLPSLELEAQITSSVLPTPEFGDLDREIQAAPTRVERRRERARRGSPRSWEPRSAPATPCRGWPNNKTTPPA